VVYVNGIFASGKEASISVFDHGLLYGDAVFDTIRLYEGMLFKLDDHIDRLFDSAKGIAISPSITKTELSEVVKETVRRNKLKNAHIRIVLTRGLGVPGLDPRSCPSPTLIVSAYEFPPILGRKPLRLLISTVRKKSFSIDAKIKCTNYLDSVLAKLQATAGNFDDAIMLDKDGFVAESTGSNIFVVRRNELLTPLPTSCLRGITRQTILSLSRELRITATETFLTPHDLYAADESFLASTGIDGVAPIAEVDGRKIGEECPGPITKRISSAYLQLTKTEFLTPVY
jgi:branched-chain amino acid aminotransferase